MMPFIPNGVKGYFHFQGGIYMELKQMNVPAKIIQLVDVVLELYFSITSFGIFIFGNRIVVNCNI